MNNIVINLSLTNTEIIKLAEAADLVGLNLDELVIKLASERIKQFVENGERL